MRIGIVTVVALLAGAPPARAGGVGVVVTGDPLMNGRVASHFEAWLEKHGHKIVSTPLSADAINTMLNCAIADDSKCLRGVVEARSKAKSLVFARVEHTEKSKDVTFTTYWLIKGHDPISERRVCEKCTEDSWHGIADSMMSALSGSSQSELGKLVLTSDPPGLMVMLDNVQIGVTPLQSDLPAGEHVVKLAHAGRTVGKKRVSIESGETTTLRMQTDVEVAQSRVLPTLLIIGGGVSAAAGGAELYLGSLGGRDQKYVYSQATPIGIGLVTVGVGGLLGGIIMLVQKPDDAPVVALTPHGGYVGWTSTF